MALVFAFPKLLSVICYLYRKKFIYGNCQLSTVTLAIDIGFALMMSGMYDYFVYTQCQESDNILLINLPDCGMKRNVFVKPNEQS